MCKHAETGRKNSQIAIQFDKAELKGGQTVAIESIIQSVSPAAGSGVDNSVPNAPSALGASPASPRHPAEQASSSPSMNGSTPTNEMSGSANQSSNRPGGESNGTAQPGQTASSMNGGMPAPGTIVARNGNVAIRTTAIPGVLLANALNGSLLRMHPVCLLAPGVTFISTRAPGWLSRWPELRRDRGGMSR